MILLKQFPRSKQFVNLSFFCSKLECFLRMTDLPYEIKWVLNPRTMPRGKLPVVVVDGETIADSSIIIEKLKSKFQLKIDEHISEHAKLNGILLQRTLEDHLVPIILYFRWQSDLNWPQFRDLAFAKLPGLVRPLISSLARKDLIKRLRKMGVGRMTATELLDAARLDLAACDQFLGEKQYFFGERPSSFDAVAFGVLGNCRLPVTPELRDLMAQFPRLNRFVDRMLDIYFPDLGISN